ncbi:uncharacterized protein LOC128491189 [Spea bombifrons]|uniref:uncharacterized protein LOC128491189 n=1 Tax=Spea bombifrons TaxID=233779 RepID=UPI00234A398F|nr:uncharacterized protein LOC128491189 [Spea bombifrons]
MLGAHNNSADLHGNTPLHYAAHANDINQVNEILKSGCNILNRNGSGLTALHFAAFGGHVEILQKLLNYVPQAINIQSIKGASLMHEAVRGKCIEAVKFLIDIGANLNLQDQDGNTPLHLAGSIRPARVASLISQSLMQGGADTGMRNKNGEHFLFNVVRRAAMDHSQDADLLVSLALQYQTDLLIRNCDGFTVLDVARMAALPGIVTRKIQDRTQAQQKAVLDKSSFQGPRNVIFGQPHNHDVSLSPEQLPSPEYLPSVLASNFRLGRKAKLFICGHSRVGKTTFTNTLRQTGLISKLQYLLIDPKAPPSTKGVCLSHTDLEDDSVVIWDFAGQMEYYFTHSLLLATGGANTIYCLIFSLKGIESDQHGGQNQAIKQVIFWLRFLSVTRHSNACHHLILIGSHMDTLTEENRLEIANRFFYGVMDQELELFNCFKIQFFPINCKSLTDVGPVREELGKIVTQTLQESMGDTIPVVCQFVMEQITLLRRQKIRFQSWNDFAKSVTQGLSEPLCTNILLTAVEYLHNISELLYLSHSSAATANQTLNINLNSIATCQPNTVSRHTSLQHIKPVNSTCLAFGLCSCGCGTPSPSGLVVLEVSWLLQEIFGTFSNFLLSPASGKEKEYWSLSEVETALELKDGEGDTKAAVQLLETLELLLRTPDGYYVVPAWLKRGQPTEQVQWENVRGVVYRWQETSRGLFSQFLIGQLQVRLLGKFGSNRCRLWREGARCIAEALLRVEVSEDRRSLYLLGSWHKECNEGACYRLLEMVGRDVESLLKTFQEQGWERLHLIPRELFSFTLAEGLGGFSWEQISKAEEEGTTLCGKYSVVWPWEVLFPQHDNRMLAHLGRKCSTHWLEGNTLSKVCCMLDIIHPLGSDWRRLAEELGGATNSVVMALNDEATRIVCSPTRLVLERYPVSVEKLMEALKQMERIDCLTEVEAMMTQL